jgi:hypothetical protein
LLAMVIVTFLPRTVTFPQPMQAPAQVGSAGTWISTVSKNLAPRKWGLLLCGSAGSRLYAILGDYRMTNQLTPAFHAEYIEALYNEYGCVEKVSERANILLSSYSMEHVQAVGRRLPKDLIRVLAKRKLRVA